jgi:hypothetical protein
MGFVSFFYYYHFSEVDDNRSAVVGKKIVMERRGREWERDIKQWV